MNTMIFQHTIDKVLDGTKTKTCRIVKPGEELQYDINPHWNAVMAFDSSKVGFHRTKWAIGKTYAVQLGRGKKALHRRLAFDGNYEYSNGKPNEFGPARWHPVRIRILDIQRVDVRYLSDEDVKAEGFSDRHDFWYTWISMHDKSFLPTFRYAHECDYLHEYGFYRPSRDAHYDAWQLTFELVS